MVSRSGRDAAERRREYHVDRIVGAIMTRPALYKDFSGRAHLSRAERERMSRERQRRAST